MLVGKCKTVFLNTPILLFSFFTNIAQDKLPDIKFMFEHMNSPLGPGKIRIEIKNPFLQCLTTSKI
jgi:hypothetical protein